MADAKCSYVWHASGENCECGGIVIWFLELNWKHSLRSSIKAILGKAKVDKDLLAVDQLLNDHASGTKHGKAAILKLLGVELGEFLGIFGLEAERIESNITGVVVIVQVLEHGAGFRLETSDSSRIGRLPSNKGTVELESTNDEAKDLEEDGLDGANLIEMTDSRANVLIGGLEERVELNGFLGYEHANGGKHS